MRDKTKDKIGIIVQARMGSSRLPGKVMKEILGKTMLSILIERLMRVKNAHRLIIATTIHPRDEAIVAEVKKYPKVDLFRGSEDDVLSRYYEAARRYKLDTVIRVTSDCPLSDPAIIDTLIDYFYSLEDADYASNTLKKTFANGVDAEVCSFQALEQAYALGKRPHHKEHVTTYIYENLKCFNYEDTEDNSRFRITVDTPEDFQLVKEIFQRLQHLPFISYRDVLGLLKASPELVKINAHIQQKKVIVT